MSIWAVVRSGARVKRSHVASSARGGSSSSGLRWCCCSGTAFAVLRVKFEGAGPRRQHRVDPQQADARPRSRSARSSGRPRALKKVVTGGWVPVTVRDVRVWDDCALSAAIQATRPTSSAPATPTRTVRRTTGPIPIPTSKRKPRKLLLRTRPGHRRDRHPRADVRQPRLRVPQPLGPRRRGAARADPRAVPAPRVRPHDRQHRHRVLSAHEGRLSRRHLRRRAAADLRPARHPHRRT